MAKPRRRQNSQHLMLVGFLLLILAVLIFWYVTMNTAMIPPEPGEPLQKTVSVETAAKQQVRDSEVTGVIEKPVVIDYTDLGSDTELTQLMEERKQELGIRKSLDFIVRSNETLTIGETTVAMRDILEKAFMKHQEVFEEKIDESGQVQPEELKNYGIYIVQPGDNIWNIHFRIIQEYYGSRGIAVEQTADEPLDDGRSSGVGKLLKFSEKVVIIYNLPDKKISDNINLIKPLTKIVIYSMDEVFNLLRDIDYENVDSIRFDGETIWIPAQQPRT